MVAKFNPIASVLLITVWIDDGIHPVRKLEQIQLNVDLILQIVSFSGHSSLEDVKFADLDA